MRPGTRRRAPKWVARGAKLRSAVLGSLLAVVVGLLAACNVTEQYYEGVDSFGKQTGVPVQMGVGGALDFIAGVVPRAPERWQRLNLEWLWRLKEEPWRWRRMLALPRFALAAAWEAAYNRRPNEG